MTPPLTAGFHHVGLVSGSASRTDAFYGGVLGLQRLHPAAGADLAAAGDVLLYGDRAGAPGTLLLFRVERGVRAGNPGIGGVHHIALGVASDEVLLMWKRRLTDFGVRVTGPYDRGYFTSIYFADPDGQIVELATNGPGYAIDEASAELGRGMMVPPQRIVRGFRDEAAIAALTHPDPVPELTPAMELDGLHHISGITDDLAAAGVLLEDGLGLGLVKRTTNRDDPSQLHYFWAVQHGADVQPRSAFTLFGWPAGWRRTRPGIGQVSHVAYRAADDDELEAWREHLLRMGVAASGIEPGPFWSAIRFPAPDGHVLELVAAP